MARRSEPVRPRSTGSIVLLADLDGVVYTGPDALPYAVESINRAQQSDPRRLSDQQRVAHRRHGRGAPDRSRTHRRARRRRDVAAGGDGRCSRIWCPRGRRSWWSAATVWSTSCRRPGSRSPARPTTSRRPSCRDSRPRSAGRELAEASFALQPRRTAATSCRGSRRTPTGRFRRRAGSRPGNGTLVSAVHTAVGRLPVVAGKPERAIFDAAVARFGASSPLFIGDRLDTDILGANRAGMPSALVHDRDRPGRSRCWRRPRSRARRTCSATSASCSSRTRRPRRASRSAAATRVVTVGDAVVRIHRNRVAIDRAGGRSIDLLRAGAAAIWGTGVADLRARGRPRPLF